MKLILGLDAGTSSTKLMAMTEDGKRFITPMRMGPMSSHKSFCAALSRFAADNAMTEEDFAWIAATGGRATHVGEEILGVPVRRMNEIEAMAAARCASASRKKAWWLIWARHHTGVCRGGQTAGAHIRQRCGRRDAAGPRLPSGGHEQLHGIAVPGRERRPPAGRSFPLQTWILQMWKALDERLTLSNFGKLRPEDNVEDKDAAAALVNLILEVVGTEAMLACRAKNCDTAIVVGTLADLPGSDAVFALFEQLCGVKFVKAGMPSFVTAAGALLRAMEQE